MGISLAAKIGQALMVGFDLSYGMRVKGFAIPLSHPALFISFGKIQKICSFEFCFNLFLISDIL
jgi:hypothetical protein